jgi:hypothetical protein
MDLRKETYVITETIKLLVFHFSSKWWLSLSKKGEEKNQRITLTYEQSQNIILDAGDVERAVNINESGHDVDDFCIDIGNNTKVRVGYADLMTRISMLMLMITTTCLMMVMKIVRCLDSAIAWIG